MSLRNPHSHNNTNDISNYQSTTRAREMDVIYVMLYNCVWFTKIRLVQFKRI